MPVGDAAAELGLPAPLLQTFVDEGWIPGFWGEKDFYVEIKGARVELGSRAWRNARFGF